MVARGPGGTCGRSRPRSHRLVLDALRRQVPREQREVLGRQWEAFVADRASDAISSQWEGM